MQFWLNDTATANAKPRNESTVADLQHESRHGYLSAVHNVRNVRGCGLNHSSEVVPSAYRILHTPEGQLRRCCRAECLIPARDPAGPTFLVDTHYLNLVPFRVPLTTKQVQLMMIRDDQEMSSHFLVQTVLTHAGVRRWD